MAKRRGNGEGYYRQLPSGRWWVQVSIPGGRPSATFDTKAEAQRWVREMRRQADRGLTYDAGKTRLGDFLTDWLENKRGELRVTTNEMYARLARLYLQPTLGPVCLQDLTPARIQAAYNGLTRDGAGARTIEFTHAILHGCLGHAVQLGLLARNPSDAVIVPKPKRKEMQVWTEAQVSQFLIAGRGHRNEHLFRLALTFGARRGELSGLMWKDIDWTGRTIHIQRQAYHPEGGGYIFQEPKSTAGLRAIRVGPGVIDCLQDQLARVDRMRRLAGDTWEELDLVFPSEVGRPIIGDTLGKEFKRLIEASGLPRIRFHDTRHTAASLMLAHGVPPVVVAGILGQSLAVLMSTYAHFIPSSQEQAASLMDSLTTVVEVDF